MQFEFFLPLTHEGYLRETLDMLFYKDTIVSRLQAVSREILNRHFEPLPNEHHEHQIERVCKWISDKFVGYSISHVNGRYRAGELRTLKEVYSKGLKTAPAYLIDETTAIVKFIFPCGQERYQQFGYDKKLLDLFFSEPDEALAEEEARKIRWLFYELFMKSMVQTVEGEDEIWLLESGMTNKLHIWRVRPSLKTT